MNYNVYSKIRDIFKRWATRHLSVWQQHPNMEKWSNDEEKSDAQAFRPPPHTHTHACILWGIDYKLLIDNWSIQVVIHVNKRCDVPYQRMNGAAVHAITCTCMLNTTRDWQTDWPLISTCNLDMNVLILVLPREQGISSHGIHFAYTQFD